jgi:hypothetical protein
VATPPLKYLLDSVILIDHLNGRDEATAFLEKCWEESAISVITRAEIMAGFEGAQASKVAGLLDRFPVFPIDVETADLASILRREKRWKLPDAFQAAIAQRNGLKLVTRNVHDFPPDRHRFVLVPYR